MELQPFGDVLSMTNSSLLAIESMSDLTRAIIEQEGVTSGLHFAQIQLRESFFSLPTSLQRDDDLPFTINCFQTHLQIATWIPVRYLDTFDFCRSCRMGFYNLERECWGSVLRGVLSNVPKTWWSQKNCKIENGDALAKDGHQLNTLNALWRREILAGDDGVLLEPSLFLFDILLLFFQRSISILSKKISCLSLTYCSYGPTWRRSP